MTLVDLITKYHKKYRIGIWISLSPKQINYELLSVFLWMNKIAITEDSLNIQKQQLIIFFKL